MMLKDSGADLLIFRSADPTAPLMHYQNFFLSCPIRNLTLASVTLFIYDKSDVIFLQALIPTAVFSPSKELLKINCTIF